MTDAGIDDKMKDRRYRLVTLILFSVALCILSVFGSFAIAFLYYRSFVYANPQTTPEHTYALVLGAGLRPDGSPSDVLTDRLDATYQLYAAHKVQKIIVSGDNRVADHNEPEAMKQALIRAGVPSEAIQPDYAGRRTYDSCYRAKHIFSLSKIVIVTQSFHMTRSLFLCNQLGVSSIGFVADKNRYLPLTWLYWSLRDIIGFTLSIVDVSFRHPSVILGKQIQF